MNGVNAIDMLWFIKMFHLEFNAFVTTIRSPWIDMDDMDLQDDIFVHQNFKHYDS